MAKAPAFQFYVRDWLTDTELVGCSLAAQGFWIAALANMFISPQRGKLEDKTYPQLASMCRCTEVEAQTHVLELSAQCVADVTTCNGLVTLMSRRMWRDDQERRAAQERQQRRRGRLKAEASAGTSRNSHGDVTGMSQDSASSSASARKEDPPTPQQLKPEMKPPSPALAADLYWFNIGDAAQRARQPELVALFKALAREGWSLGKLYQFAKEGPTSCGGSANMTKIGMTKWAKEHGSKPTQTEADAGADDMWFHEVAAMKATGTNRAEWLDLGEIGTVEFTDDGCLRVGPFGARQEWQRLHPGGGYKLRDFRWFKEAK